MLGKLTCVAVIVALSACAAPASQKGAKSVDSAPKAPNAAEQACLRDVTGTTNNPDVTLISSSFSEAGTEVIVGVGPKRAKWRCIAYKDGTTAGIESLSNEGAL